MERRDGKGQGREGGEEWGLVGTSSGSAPAIVGAGGNVFYSPAP